MFFKNIDPKTKIVKYQREYSFKEFYNFYRNLDDLSHLYIIWFQLFMIIANWIRRN